MPLAALSLEGERAQHAEDVDKWRREIWNRIRAARKMPRYVSDVV